LYWFTGQSRSYKQWGENYFTAAMKKGKLFFTATGKMARKDLARLEAQKAK